MRESRRLFSGCALVIGLLSCGSALAQPPDRAPAPADRAAPLVAAAAVHSDESSTLTFFNRPIVVLRARVLGRSPMDRAVGAERMLADLVEQGTTAPVGTRAVEGAVFITVGSRAVLALTPADVDDLAGETLDGTTAQAVARLTQALDEAAEARAPGAMFRAGVLATLGLLFAVLALWGLARAHRIIAAKMLEVAEQTVTKAGIAPLSTLRASRVLDVERYLTTAAVLIVDLTVIYVAATFILKRFPYTRPWGESMRGFLLATLARLSLGVLDSLPGLFTVLVIFVVVRFAVRLVRLWFDAVERGEIKPRWIYPDTAQPTRRLVTALLWAFGVVTAYPYMPGSQTDAFRGMSVFLGLIISLGSSGLVNQIMSGFMITYSRALHVGDFVKIGEVEGTVTNVGALSTKVLTLKCEEVTVPNAVVVSNTITDFSSPTDAARVFTPTSVTIGYDVPWRQVEAMLLLAAARTSGLHQEPKPVVFQVALEDFYVRYTLWVCLEVQEARMTTLNALHANIQDLFNEHGVQIMSPNYFTDPAAPKIVVKKDWFASPARDPSSSNVA
jgi:small-conductance mechanosensitive channel